MSEMNYSRFISSISARRPLYPLRVLPEVYARAPEGAIFMGNGMPNVTTFPFTKVTVEVKHEVTLELQGRKLEDALQYQPTPGYTTLIEQLKALQGRVHGLESTFWESRDLLVTAGTLDGLCKAVEMCMVENDPVVYQEPSYPGVGSAFRAYNPRLIAAVQDEFGVCPVKLRAALQREGTPQEIRSKTTGVPKLFYINPTGSNPTGVTIPTERKRQLYQVACDYDLIILEDDPYYFLRYGEERPVSFMSMDTEGRVLRFDSLSKVLSAGLRLGFVTGPKQLIERIELHMQVSVIHASGLAQVLVDSLLREWQDDKLDQHFKYVQNFYREQRDKMVAAATKHLTGLAEWSEPAAGIFLWLRIPGLKDVRRLVQEEGVARGVILVSGHFFMVDTEAPCPCIRASFATVTSEEMETGFARLAEIIKKEIKRNKEEK